MTCIIDETEARELAKEISRLLDDAHTKGGVPLTRDYLESIIYQELKRNPLNKTET